MLQPGQVYCKWVAQCCAKRAFNALSASAAVGAVASLGETTYCPDEGSGHLIPMAGSQ